MNFHFHVRKRGRERGRNCNINVNFARFVPPKCKLLYNKQAFASPTHMKRIDPELAVELECTRQSWTATRLLPLCQTFMYSTNILWGPLSFGCAVNLAESNHTEFSNRGFYRWGSMDLRTSTRTMDSALVCYRTPIVKTVAWSLYDWTVLISKQYKVKTRNKCKRKLHTGK